jgi:hypothetical protein
VPHTGSRQISESFVSFEKETRGRECTEPVDRIEDIQGSGRGLIWGIVLEFVCITLGFAQKLWISGLNCEAGHVRTGSQNTCLATERNLLNIVAIKVANTAGVNPSASSSRALLISNGLLRNLTYFVTDAFLVSSICLCRHPFTVKKLLYHSLIYSLRSCAPTTRKFFPQYPLPVQRFVWFPSALSGPQRFNYFEGKFEGHRPWRPIGL